MINIAEIDELISKSSINELSEISEKVQIVKKSLSEENYDKIVENFFWAYRNGEESILDSKKRFFIEIPKEDGLARVHQENLTELLKIFNKLCNEAGVGYALKGGSLIGAIRHSGFIPWDDDIDVIMLHSDFLKLIKYMEANAIYNSFEIWYLNSRFRRYFLPRFRIKGFPSLFIDIFCLAEVDSSSDRMKMRAMFRNAKKEHYETMLDFKDDFENLTKIGKEIIEGFSSKFSKKGLKDALAQAPGHNFKSDLHKASDILPFREISFENIKSYVPNNPIVYLNGMNSFSDIYSFPRRKFPAHINILKRAKQIYEIKEWLGEYER